MALRPPTDTLHPQATFRGGATQRLYYVDTDHFHTDSRLGAAVCGRLLALKAQADG